MGCREVWQGVPTWRLRSVMRHLRVEPGRTLLRIVCIRNTDVETARCTATPYTGSWNRKPAAAVQVRCVATPSAIPAAPSAPSARSEERRYGKECVRTCRYWWPPYPYKNNN